MPQFTYYLAGHSLAGRLVQDVHYIYKMTMTLDMYIVKELIKSRDGEEYEKIKNDIINIM